MEKNKKSLNNKQISIGFFETPKYGGPVTWKNIFVNFCKNYGFNINNLGENSDKNDIFITAAYLVDAEKLVQMKKNNTKVIARMNGINFEFFLLKRALGLNNKLRDTMNVSDFIVFQSNYSKCLNSQIYDVNSTPHTIIYNGADTTIFYPKKIQSDKKIILSIGHFGHPRQAQLSVDAFLDIAKRFVNNPDYEFWILGVANTNVEKLINESNLKNITKCNLHTNFNKYEVAEALNSASLVLHLKPLDACSNLILECMSCGTPIIGLNSGSTPELLEDNLLLCECTEQNNSLPTINIDDFENKINLLFKNYDIYKEKIFSRSKCFTMDIMCKKYLQIIKNILNKKFSS